MLLALILGMGRLSLDVDALNSGSEASAMESVHEGGHRRTLYRNGSVVPGSQFSTHVRHTGGIPVVGNIFMSGATQVHHLWRRAGVARVWAAGALGASGFAIPIVVRSPG